MVHTILNYFFEKGEVILATMFLECHHCVAL